MRDQRLDLRRQEVVHCTAFLHAAARTSSTVSSIVSGRLSSDGCARRTAGAVHRRSRRAELHRDAAARAARPRDNATALQRATHAPVCGVYRKI
jgi:hypothetical protein